MDNIYFLWVVLPNLDKFFGTLGFIGLIIGIIGFIISAILHGDAAYNEEGKERAFNMARHSVYVLIVSVVCIFITCFIPNKKELMQLKAFTIISEAKDVDKLPQKIIDKLNDLMEIEPKGKSKNE